MDIVCKRCGAAFDESLPLCPGCNALIAMRSVCPVCRFRSPRRYLFCPHCGIRSILFWGSPVATFVVMELGISLFTIPFAMAPRDFPRLIVVGCWLFVSLMVALQCAFGFYAQRVINRLADRTPSLPIVSPPETKVPDRIEK
jgi:hypothetical protein